VCDVKAREGLTAGAQSFARARRRVEREVDDALDLDAFDVSEGEDEDVRDVRDAGETTSAVAVRSVDVNAARTVETVGARAADAAAEDVATRARVIEVADASKECVRASEIVFRVPSSRAARRGVVEDSPARASAATSAHPRASAATSARAEATPVASEREVETARQTPLSPSVPNTENASARDVGAVSAQAMETVDATMTLTFDDDDDKLEEDELRALAELEAMEESMSSHEREADEREREEVARAIARAEHLRVELDDLAFASTELLLKTITSTNDYFLLFNPQLMKELAGMQREARAWLERTAPKVPSSSEGAPK